MKKKKKSKPCPPSCIVFVSPGLCRDCECLHYHQAFWDVIPRKSLDLLPNQNPTPASASMETSTEYYNKNSVRGLLNSLLGLGLTLSLFPRVSFIADLSSSAKATSLSLYYPGFREIFISTSSTPIHLKLKWGWVKVPRNQVLRCYVLLKPLYLTKQIILIKVFVFLSLMDME